MTEAAATVPPSSVRQMQLGPMANFVYLIGCETTKEAAIVDPGWNADAIVASAERAGYRITTLIVTHSHFDHINATAALQEKTGAAIYANALELPALEKVAGGWRSLDDAEVLAVGAVPVTAMHTPGHTPGSQCLLVGGRVLTGDTLFIGSIGRCDLPGSDPTALYNSIMRLKSLPSETVLLPGHNYAVRPSSTIGEQAQTNLYLRIPSPEAFLEVMGL